MLIYAALAIVFLILVISLHRKVEDTSETFAAESYAPKLASGRWLDLSVRIFDSSDARWLVEDLAFPHLAKDLVADRKRLAIRWLQALQKAFDDVVRSPETGSASDPEADATGGWQPLWLTLRFKLLVSYALFVVRVFGPYHRLIPSFGFLPLSRATRGGREAFAESRGSQ